MWPPPSVMLCCIRSCGETLTFEFPADQAVKFVRAVRTVSCEWDLERRKRRTAAGDFEEENLPPMLYLQEVSCMIGSERIWHLMMPERAVRYGKIPEPG